MPFICFLIVLSVCAGFPMHAACLGLSYLALARGKAAAGCLAVQQLQAASCCLHQSLPAI